VQVTPSAAQAKDATLEMAPSKQAKIKRKRILKSSKTQANGAMILAE